MKSLDYGAVVENKRRHKTETHEEKAKRVCFEGHLACVKINQISEPANVTMSLCFHLLHLLQSFQPDHFLSMVHTATYFSSPASVEAKITEPFFFQAALTPRSSPHVSSTRKKHRPHGNSMGPQGRASHLSCCKSEVNIDRQDRNAQIRLEQSRVEQIRFDQIRLYRLRSDKIREDKIR